MLSKPNPVPLNLFTSVSVGFDSTWKPLFNLVLESLSMCIIGIGTSLGVHPPLRSLSWEKASSWSRSTSRWMFWLAGQFRSLRKVVLLSLGVRWAGELCWVFSITKVSLEEVICLNQPNQGIFRTLLNWGFGCHNQTTFRIKQMLKRWHKGIWYNISNETFFL